MASIPQSGGDGPMERQSHDEHQAAETLRIVDVSVLDGEAPGFEVGEHGFDAPASAVFQGFQIPGLGGHGDDPGVGMTRILDDADVARLPVSSTSSR